jgi:hypothetical protein
MRRKISEMNAERKQQSSEESRNWFQKSRPMDDPQKSAVKIDYSGASWSGERARGISWGGGRER